MRSNPEERDSWNVHRARGTASDERDSHPRWCSFPRGLHLRLRWWYISRLQFKATGPNFHTELFPVHSPLLKESYLVSYPPLTYMLKFSGFADLASCREGCARGADQQHGFSSDTQRSWPSKYHHISKLFGCKSNTTVQLRQQKGQREPSRVLGTMPDTHWHKMAPRNTALYSSPTTVGMSSVCGCGVDTEAGMLPGISRKRSIRSNPYWFTEFCNSQCLSHFAAPFIVVRAETSVAESCEQDASAIALMSKEQTNHRDTKE